MDVEEEITYEGPLLLELDDEIGFEYAGDILSRPKKVIYIFIMSLFVQVLNIFIVR